MIRYYESKDYPKLKEIWGQYPEWTAIPEEMLPKIGVVVENEGKQIIASGFLYQTDSQMCYMEWILANKDFSEFSRGRATSMVVKALINEGKRLKFKTIFTCVKHAGLKRLYARQGLKETDKEMSNFIGRLQ